MKTIDVILAERVWIKDHCMEHVRLIVRFVISQGLG